MEILNAILENLIVHLVELSAQHSAVGRLIRLMNNFSIILRDDIKFRNLKNLLFRPLFFIGVHRQAIFHSMMAVDLFYAPIHLGHCF